MKIILLHSLALGVLLVGVAWWVFSEGYPFSKEAALALINVFSIVAIAMFTYIRTTERDEKKFRRELLDKFLDEAGHWAYFPEDVEKLKDKTRGGYLAGLFARYHRVRAGIEDPSDLQKFGQLFDAFKKEAERYWRSSPKDEDRLLEKAIGGMTDFLRSHYLK